MLRHWWLTYWARGFDCPAVLLKDGKECDVLEIPSHRSQPWKLKQFRGGALEAYTYDIDMICDMRIEMKS